MITTQKAMAKVPRHLIHLDFVVIVSAISVVVTFCTRVCVIFVEHNPEIVLQYRGFALNALMQLKFGGFMLFTMGIDVPFYPVHTHHFPVRP